LMESDCQSLKRQLKDISIILIGPFKGTVVTDFEGPFWLAWIGLY